MNCKVGVLIALIAGMAGCKTEKAASSSEASMCVDGDSHCGNECSTADPCPTGLFCDDGECAKECVVRPKDSAKAACRGAMHCSDDGECVSDDDDAIAGESPPDGSTQSGDSGGLGGGDGAAADGGSTTKPDAAVEKCATTSVRTTRVVPTVILIVDQSVSMNEDFGGDTRWNTLRTFLLGEPKGLISDLQAQVRFGLALYSAVSNEDGAGPLPVGECPVLSTVEPAFDNFDAIKEVYSAAEPIDDGPTGDAIDKLVETLGLANPDADVGTNTVFVLATDGEPDRCEELDPPTPMAKQESIDALTRAFALGIRTYVISVGGEVGEDHQQELANAGLGVMLGQPDAEYWTAGDDGDLRAALNSIVSAQLGCEIALDARVADGTECEGTVTLNGADLECNGREGWKLVDPSHIQLLGDACEELKANVKANESVVLDAKFPCTFSD